MLPTLSLALVLLAGAYLVTLGVVSLLAPDGTGRFLGAFAGSARAHWAELVLRAVLGAALLAHAPRMRWPEVFTAAGWVLVVTTAVLAAVPWRWHRRFARWAVPQAARYPRLIGAASLLLGGFVLIAAALGPVR